MNFKNRDFKETDELFKGSKILPIALSKDLNNSKVLWKAGNDLLHPPLDSLFNKRPNGTFHLPHRRIDLTQSCISYHGVQTWNRIPLDIRSSSSLDVFKNKYKQFLLDSI